jgi:cyclic 2,3-diphosphoglycerate synthetase
MSSSGYYSTHRGLKPTLVLIDGEHYPPVVRATLEHLPHHVVGALLVGGTEKLGGTGDNSYGVPVLRLELEEALAATGATHVVDLCDEPVLGPPQRMRMVSRALACGASYEGADFSFTPPRLIGVETHSIGFVGTGKRIGKTAVVTHAARKLAVDRRLVVVAMGRGGPAQPELITTPPTVFDLLARSRAGQHAASDYLEHAVLAGVPTIGCRRCGGGLAGTPFTSNLPEGVRLAVSLDPELVLFDGSGAALPPVRTDRRVVIVPAHLPSHLLSDHLTAYRVLVSDLALVTMAKPGAALRRITAALTEIKRLPIVPIDFRPRCTTDISGLRVAFFSTAAGTVLRRLAHDLEQTHGCHIVYLSGNLADRVSLRRELGQIRAEAYVVEIKAAAIDVVTEHAVAQDTPVVFCRYKPQALPGWPPLTAELTALADRDPR